jgi:hypothetical protein
MGSTNRLVYLALCGAIGIPLAWIPSFFHGPIPEKFDLFYLNGAVMVWGWYLARMLIGLLVGITVLPRQWFLRGPLCGLLAMVPLGIVSLGIPGCGPP